MLIQIPVPARTLSVVAFVYAVLQLIKLQPWAAKWLRGAVAIAFNVGLSVAGLAATIPANQLYTWTTAQTLILAALGAAGVHGTVRSITTNGSTTKEK